MGGFVVLVVQATSVADERKPLDPYSSGAGCSNGTIERQRDCLTREIEQIKQRLDGNDGRVLPPGHP
jgi:hypothetical protein